MSVNDLLGVAKRPASSPVYSEVWVSGYSTLGTAANYTPRWSTILNYVGNAIDYKDDPAKGGIFYAREEGIYAMTYHFSPDTAGVYGILFNSDVASTTTASGQLLAAFNAATVHPISPTAIKYMRVGDYVKPTGVAGATYSDNDSIKSSFRITKIA